MLGHGCSAALQDFFDRGWEEVGFLGSGARGSVLRVRNIEGGSQSALKRSTADEVRALQSLSDCRSVIALQEHFHGDDPDDVWARLELLDGGSLRSYLRSMQGQVSEDCGRFVLQGVLAGLEDIHQRGWMHRDVKAENIGFLGAVGTESCCPKLMDFDTAAAVPKGCNLYESIGTVENMAPEVFAGNYDELADCWSLGVVAYEMLFGYRPFNDAHIERVEEMVRNWERYLLLPSDASEQASSFVRGLLSGRQDRLCSREAAKHCWLIGGSSSPWLVAPPAPCVSDDTYPKPPLASVLPAVSIPLVCGSPPSGHLSGGYRQISAGRRHTVAESSLHDAVARLPLFAVDAVASGVGQASGMSEQVRPRPRLGLHVHDTTDSLVRLRHSLSEWNQRFESSVCSASTASNERAAVVDSFVDSDIGTKLEEVRRRVSTHVEAANAVLRDAATGISTGCKSSIDMSARGSPCDDDGRLAWRSKSRSKTAVDSHSGPRGVSDRSTVLSECSGGSSSSSSQSLHKDDAEFDRKTSCSDVVHDRRRKDYLQQIRSRAQEVLVDAESHVSELARRLDHRRRSEHPWPIQRHEHRRRTASGSCGQQQPLRSMSIIEVAAAERPAPTSWWDMEQESPLSPSSPSTTSRNLWRGTDDLHEELRHLQHVRRLSQLQLRQLEDKIQQQSQESNDPTCRSLRRHSDLAVPAMFAHDEGFGTAAGGVDGQSGGMSHGSTSPEDQVVAHLRDVRQKTQELLRHLSTSASVTDRDIPPCVPTVISDTDDKESVSSCLTTLRRQTTPSSRSASHLDHGAEPSDVNSPLAWLAGQRRRTETLLTHFKKASADLGMEPISFL